MEHQTGTTINPDEVCRRVIQARMSAYEAKEHFESVLKTYNDQVATLVNVVGLMKGRILELESAATASVPEQSDEPAT